MSVRDRGRRDEATGTGEARSGEGSAADAPAVHGAHGADDGSSRRRVFAWVALAVGVVSPLAWYGVVHDYAIPLRWRDAHVHAVPLLGPGALAVAAVHLLLHGHWWRWLAGALLLVVALNAWVASLLMFLPLVLLRGP